MTIDIVIIYRIYRSRGRPGLLIEEVLVTAINDTLGGRDTFLATLQDNITTVLSRGNDKTLSEIVDRLVELQTELLKLANSKADYEDVAEEIYRLREQKQKAMLENAGRDELRKRIDDMCAFLQEQPTAILGRIQVRRDGWCESIV